MMMIPLQVITHGSLLYSYVLALMLLFLSMVRLIVIPLRLNRRAIYISPTVSFQTSISACANGQVVPWPTPWRVQPNAFEVPLRLCMFCADPNRMLEVSRREDNYLHELESDILNNGIQHPVVIAFDQVGQMRLYDGHHRVLVLSRLGFESIPAHFRRTTVLSGYHKPIYEYFLPELQRGANG